MAIRYTYTLDELKYLRDSPLVGKPLNLPPAEEWMGPPADGARNPAKPTDRTRSEGNILTDQSSRRPVAERHISRNSANPESVVLAPPKTSFMSATSIRNPTKPFDSPDRPPLRESDSRDRFSFRNKQSEGEGERLRENRNNTLRPKRADGDDSDGWSTVKPRKSFGNEGAERFNGRMGVGHREERRFKDRDDRDGKEKPRGFDTFVRDRVEKDVDQDQDRDHRRNGTGRGRNEPSWFKDNNDQPPTPRDRNSNGDRLAERSRGWREKDRDERPERNDRGGDRPDRGGGGGGGDRGDRRWDRDRDQRQEREPEWMDSPAEEKTKTHTQEEFEKWKEQMQGKDKPAKTPLEESAPQPDAGLSFFELEPKKKVETPLAIESGPDKFFKLWSEKGENPPDAAVEPKQEGIPKSKTVGKASRFTSFFGQQEEPQRRQTEPPTAPPTQQMAASEGLGALFGGPQSSQGQADHVAFQQLLAKLKNHPPAVPNTSTPPANDSQQRKPPPNDPMINNYPTPEPFLQYRQEEPRPVTRNAQQVNQEFVAQRQMTGSQPAIRQEQILQDLVVQRANALSQGSSRPDQPQTRNSNSDFLMGLMQSAKAAPEPQRSEQVLLGLQQNNGLDRHMQQQRMLEQEHRREALLRERERSVSQRQIQTQPPPGFYEDPNLFQRNLHQQQHERQPAQPQQPTAILRRPVMDRPAQNPPGLEMGWDRQSVQFQALHAQQPQHRIPQGPPPGLAGGRGMPMPHYPPGFPMNEYPPPNMMAGPAGPSGPPRNMPPPGFFNGPPPGFLPQFQDMPFGPPFDGRGPPTQGAYRRQ